MSGDDNMVEKGSDISAQIETNTTKVSEQVLPEWGGVDGTALVESYKNDIVAVTGGLANENQRIAEQDGVELSQESKGEISKRAFLTTLSIASVALLLEQAACAPKPVNADTQPTANVAITDVQEEVPANIEEVTEEDMYPATPSIEEAMSPAPVPTIEEDYHVDFSVTPEEWNQLFDGDDNYSAVLRSLKENKDRYYQYQVWLENGQAFGMVGKSAYFSEIQGKSMLVDYMGSLGDQLGWKEGDLELKVFDKVMESQLFVPREYLTDEIKDVRATVVRMELEGDKYIYDFLGEGGGVYVNDGEVEIIKSGELPDYLPTEVKEKFKEYKRVDSNNGVIEGSGLRESE